MPKGIVPIDIRFFAHCDTSKDCWEWQSTLTKDGYGKVWWKGKQFSAHKVSWYLHFGEYPSSEAMVCHHCDNPKCVNPDHLYLGDQYTNQQDAVKRLRHKEARKNYCKNGHEFTLANIYFWRNHRYCRACRYLRNLYRNKNAKH